MASTTGVPSADPSPFLASTLVTTGSPGPPRTAAAPSAAADPTGTAPPTSGRSTAGCLSVPPEVREPEPRGPRIELADDAPPSATPAPGRRSTPPQPAGGRYARPRPEAVTAAAVLWIVLGAGLLVWAAAIVWTGTVVPTVVPLSGAPAGATAAVLALAGVGVVALAAAMLHGSETARTALTVLGAVVSVAGLPLALVVPAVVLALHPSVGPWLADAALRRARLRH